MMWKIDSGAIDKMEVLYLVSVQSTLLLGVLINPMLAPT